MFWENGIIATELCIGHGFQIGIGPDVPPEPSSWQSPVYPLMLCKVGQVFDGRPITYLLISLVQAAALSSILYPVFFLTRRWFDEPAARVAMGITVVLPLYLWYATRLHQAGLAMVAHAWLLWLWMRMRDPDVSWLRGALTGAITGLAALLQPTVLGTLGLVGVWTLISVWLDRAKHPAWLRRAGVLIVAGVVILLVLTPWTVRNYRVHGKFVPIRDSFGKEFWMGNNPNATGTGFMPGGDHEITFAHPPRALAERRPSDREIDVMEGMLDEGMAYVRAEPRAFVTRTARKIWWFWTAPPSVLLRRDAQWVQTIVLTLWLTIVSLSAIGAYVRWPIPREYRVVLAIYAGMYSVLYGLTHVGQVRYRGEIEFVFLPLAACGLLALAQRFTRRAPGPAASA